MGLFNQPSQKNILTVDDERIIQKMMHKLLTKHGYNVITANNGKEALNHLVVYEIDLIILDIMMPVMDGYETLKMLRQMERTRMIPVIILTANANVKTFTRVIKMGADDFIAKPFDQGNLRRKLEYLLQDAERRKEELQLMLQEEKAKQFNQKELLEKQQEFMEGFEKIFPKMVYLVSSQSHEELRKMLVIFEKKCEALQLENGSRLALKIILTIDQDCNWEVIIKYLEELYGCFMDSCAKK